MTQTPPDAPRNTPWRAKPDGTAPRPQLFDDAGNGQYDAQNGNGRDGTRRGGLVKCPCCNGTGKVRNNAAAVEMVLDHYRKYHPRYRGDRKGKAKIAQRIADGFTVDELCQAIDGCHLSPFHCGENDAGVKYQKLETIFRDADQVTTFVELWEQKNAAKQSRQRSRDANANRNARERLRIQLFRHYPAARDWDENTIESEISRILKTGAVVSDMQYGGRA